MSLPSRPPLSPVKETGASVARVAFTGGVAGRRRAGSRAATKTQWNWLHATTCSAAVVASGAYMHSVLSVYVDASLDVHGGASGFLSSCVRAVVAAATGTRIVLPWRSLLVITLMVGWGLTVVLLRRLGIHQPVHHAAHHLRTAAASVHNVAVAKFHQSTGCGRSGRSRRTYSAELLEIDQDDMLIVTSLSLEHKLPTRYRRATQLSAASLVTSASPASTVSSTSSRESSETVDADDDDHDAQILLHPHQGATGGRHQSNHIIVDDPYVSRFHFAIGYDPLEKEYFLQDAGSTTGTFVFLKPDVPKRLSVDDRVRLGDSEFEVVAIDANPTTGTPFLRICFTEGPLRGVGQTIGKTAVSLGRRSSNALCITDDASISGRHSVISYLGDAFYITDLQSTNGTAVRLSASGVQSARRFLLHGDVFGVGANRFLVEYAHELQLQEKNRALQEEDDALRRAAAAHS